MGVDDYWETAADVVFSSPVTRMWFDANGCMHTLIIGVVQVTEFISVVIRSESAGGAVSDGLVLWLEVEVKIMAEHFGWWGSVQQEAGSSISSGGLTALEFD
eukprot:12427960-Karenia_brevis.AAC.1